jgi:uncharacterized protein
LPKLADRVIVPPAVVEELAAGRMAGHHVPTPESLSWIGIIRPAATSVQRLIGDLGRGETEVLALAMERAGAVAVLDDKLARSVAESQIIPFTGTLGILLDAKRIGLVDTIAPILEQLQALRFRVSPTARAIILQAAGE